jgi:hypothetical protein
VPIVDPRDAIEAEFTIRSHELAERRLSAATTDERKAIDAELKLATKERRRKLRAARRVQW